MKKIKNLFGREGIVNIIISFMLLFVLAFSFSDSVQSVFNANSLKAIYNGDTNKKQVSLMINVYWGTEFLVDMLDVLDKYDAKCTFFVGGMWVSENDNILNEIFKRGHEIGNHGYYHKDSDKISKDRLREEISVNHELVKTTIGVEMNLFAPPSGAYNDATLEVANELGYTTIMWTKDTIDWRDKNTELIYNRAVKNPQNGDLILMHPTQCTLNALERIIKFYLNEGFNLVSVSENICTM